MISSSDPKDVFCDTKDAAEKRSSGLIGDITSHGGESLRVSRQQVKLSRGGLLWSYIRRSAPALHTMGKMGTGKATLLRNLIVEDLEAGHQGLCHRPARRPGL